MVFAVLLLANHLGRPFEHILVGLRIPALICTMGIIVALGFGLSAFKTKVGMALAALVGWMVLIIPLSTWRSGSVLYVRNYLQFWTVLFMIIACAPKTFKHLKFLTNIIAIAAISNILIAGRFESQYRFEMNGTFANSDDAAILAGFAIPFWMLLASRFNLFLRIPLAAAGILFLVRIIVLTATRSIMISLACLFLVWFLRSKMMYRILGTLTVGIAMFAILDSAPVSVQERLSTISSAFTATRENYNDEAAGSAAERRNLLRAGIWATLTHPIWGVGPGQFDQYHWGEGQRSGGPRQAWIKTHNTYVEISSENGIPGLLLYLFLIWTIFKTIQRVRKATISRSSPNLQLGYQLALCLEAALAFFLVTALFMTVEAHPYLFILAGAAVAVERLTQVELAHIKRPQMTLGNRGQLAPSGFKRN